MRRFVFISLIVFALARASSAELGGRFDAGGQTVTLQVYSASATRLEAWFYDQPLNVQEVLRVVMTANSATHIWKCSLPVSNLRSAGVSGTIYYGYRAWGPNWTFDPAWTKGSETGFQVDVDSSGNRFNPNKLLIDPYALDVSHDPLIPTGTGQQIDGTVYRIGPADRDKDSGPFAPKTMVIAQLPGISANKPTRAFKDEIIYEVNLRGFTEADVSVDAAVRGTYAGAAQKAQYLKDLGVTALELLPVQNFQNDANDVTLSTDGDNYWGYDPIDYFAPDRRYSSNKDPGGPAKEFQLMVQALHAKGIKVYMDVVYNHTGEGRLDSTTQPGRMLTFGGLDNSTYYEVTSAGNGYQDNNGVAPNLNTANTIVRNLIIDSLKYWSNVMGVDGFRFDLAPVLGNSCAKDCYVFNGTDSQNALNRAIAELPLRPAQGGKGVDLIAEPWGGAGDGTYQLGAFPTGWAQWNDQFRDTFRRSQNLLGVEDVKPADLASRFAGSSDKFTQPWYSLNFVVAHDGFTLRDLYSYNAKVNTQPWDKGPSDGGSDSNRSWDQGGQPDMQRQAARTGMALLMLSAGVPMITGGDEMYRTQFGNNNMYNVDSASDWLSYDNAVQQPHFAAYSRKLLAFRSAHPSLRPAAFFKGTDNNSNGLKDITWLNSDGKDIVTEQPDYFADSTQHFLGYRIDSSEFGEVNQSVYVLYNGWKDPVTATLPPNIAGKKWYRVADTASWMESMDNFNSAGAEELLADASYTLAGRSLLLLIEK